MIIQVEVIVLGAAFARGFAEELGRAAAQDVWRGLKHFIAQVFEIRRRPAAGRAPFASTSLTGSSSSRTGFPMTASDSWSREARQRAAIPSGMRSSSAGTSIKSAGPAAERVPGWRAVHARRRDARRNAAAASLPAPGTSTLAHSWLTEIATRPCRER
jgi:hypothetical protein